MYIINGKHWINHLPDLGPNDEYIDVSKLLNNMTPEMMVKVRAAINGKLSKRVITPEQQAKMQAARKPRKPTPNPQ